MIIPRQVLVSESCVCVGSLGKVEIEAAAACIVLYHWEHSPDEWIPVTRRQIADWIPRSALLARAIVNPYWKPDIVGFCEGGYIEGWDVKGPEGADIPGTLTQKFFDAIERALPKIIFTDVEIHRDEPKDELTMDFENMGGPEVPCDAEK